MTDLLIKHIGLYLDAIHIPQFLVQLKSPLFRSAHYLFKVCVAHRSDDSHLLGSRPLASHCVLQREKKSPSPDSSFLSSSPNTHDSIWKRFSIDFSDFSQSPSDHHHELWRQKWRQRELDSCEGEPKQSSEACLKRGLRASKGRYAPRTASLHEQQDWGWDGGLGRGDRGVS